MWEFTPCKKWEGKLWNDCSIVKGNTFCGFILGSKLPEPEIDGEIEEVSMDEMWHFIHKKNEEYGSGGRWIVVTTKPSDGLLAVVMLKHSDA